MFALEHKYQNELIRVDTGSSMLLLWEISSFHASLRYIIYIHHWGFKPLVIHTKEVKVSSNMQN